MTADDDPDEAYFGDSPSKCWTQILRAIGAKTNSKRATFSISGAKQFGLSNHSIRKIIANLPVDSNANGKRKATSKSERPQKKLRLEKEDDAFKKDTAPGHDVDEDTPSIASVTIEIGNKDPVECDTLVTKLKSRWNSVKTLLQTEAYVTSTFEHEASLDSVNISAYAKIRSELPYISVDEMKEGLQDYQAVDELMDMLETHSFLKNIRRRVAEATGGVVETSKARQKKTPLSVSYDADTDQPTNAPKYDKKKTQKTEDNLYERKKKASTKEKSDPNAYYYYFLPGNETRKLGAWSKEEKETFVARMNEFDMNTPKWGLFSLGIPGRTGKQCATHYRNCFRTNKGIDFVEGPRKRAKNVEHVAPKKKKIIFEDSDSDGLECVVIISE